MFRYSSESLESNIRRFIYFNFNSGNFASILANNYVVVSLYSRIHSSVMGVAGIYIKEDFKYLWAKQ